MGLPKKCAQERPHEYTDVFLSHNWGADQRGRNNHDRVSYINEELKSRGYVTWFDNDRMTGDIQDIMAEGIENTKVVVLFITESYRTKVCFSFIFHIPFRPFRPRGGNRKLWGDFTTSFNSGENSPDTRRRK